MTFPPFYYIISLENVSEVLYMEVSFNKEKVYNGPALIKFEEPVTIKLKNLQEFLDSYKAFPGVNVWGYGVDEVGDFGNYCKLIYESIAISPEYSEVHREATGIYKAGETSFQKVKYAWYYREGRPFWNRPMERLYENTYKSYTYIDEVEVTLDGVYIISYADMRRVEAKAETSPAPNV